MGSCEGVQLSMGREVAVRVPRGLPLCIHNRCASGRDTREAHLWGSVGTLAVPDDAIKAE